MRNLHIKKSIGEHNEEAFDLVRDIYEIEGYQFQKQDFLKYNDMRTLFTLHKNEELLGTISMLKDVGGMSLPLSSLYQDEVEALRQVYREIYEVGNFVIDSRKVLNRFSQESLLGSRLLFKEVYEEAKRIKAELLVIVINPKHLSFYKLIGFKEFGTTKFYPFVNAPAVPLKYEIAVDTSEANFFSRI
jgi:hypothetical protein